MIIATWNSGGFKQESKQHHFLEAIKLHLRRVRVRVGRRLTLLVDRLLYNYKVKANRSNCLGGTQTK